MLVYAQYLNLNWMTDRMDITGLQVLLNRSVSNLKVYVEVQGRMTRSKCYSYRTGQLQDRTITDKFAVLDGLTECGIV